MQVWHYYYFNIMPSQRKRIGFLPSEEVHKIIDKLCRANEFSQSKVTGLLVEEALRSRGILGDTSLSKTGDKKTLINDCFEQAVFSKSYKSTINRNDYAVNKNIISDNIDMMKEFIEYKYFKKVMKQNSDVIE